MNENNIGRPDTTGVVFRKSTMSNSDNGCVGVGIDAAGNILLRDEKNPAGPVLQFTPHEWTCFLDGANKGEFNLPQY